MSIYFTQDNTSIWIRITEWWSSWSSSKWYPHRSPVIVEAEAGSLIFKFSFYSPFHTKKDTHNRNMSFSWSESLYSLSPLTHSIYSSKLTLPFSLAEFIQANNLLNNQTSTHHPSLFSPIIFFPLNLNIWFSSVT